jgi:acetyl esterase/lipase
MQASILIPIPPSFDVEVEDVEYQRIDDLSLPVRLYRPVGASPQVAMVDVHGGAWVLGDRTQHQAMDQALAGHGVLVASVEFRQPPGNPYPTSLQDVNLAIRWLKLHAAEYGVAPGARIGAFGGSSGGHVVILAGMRPRDPRYSALPLPGGEGLDAALDFVITDAPVTDPVARFEDGQRANNTQLVERHHLYWTPPESAAEGSPTHILARGEAVALPPLLITQGTDDQAVPLAQTEAFVERYRAAGGQVTLKTYPGLGHGFILQDPARPESIDQARTVLAFVDNQLP